VCSHLGGSLSTATILRMVILDGHEVRVIHGVFGGDTLCMVVSEHLAEEVDSLFGGELSIGLVTELLPLLLGELAESIVVVAV